MDLPIWDISCKFNHIIGYGYVPLWDLDHKEGRTPKNWCLWTVVLEKTPESLLHSKEIKPVNLMGDQLWKDWCWSWSSSILVIWCEQLTHWKSPWCWERLRAEGEEGIRGWDGLIASLMQWTWTWANSERWWGTGRPGVLQSMGSQRVGHDWAIEQQQQYVVLWDWLLSFSVMFSKSIHIATHVFYWWIVLHFMDMCLCAWLLSHVWLLQPHAWTVAHQSPLSVEFSRQEYQSGLPFPSPGNPPYPGIEPTSPALAGITGGFFTAEPRGGPKGQEINRTPIHKKECSWSIGTDGNIWDML